MSDHEHTSLSLADLPKGAMPWIQVAGAGIGVISFFLMLGILIGPISEMPKRFDEVMSKLTEIQNKQTKTDWEVDALKKNDIAIDERVRESGRDRERMWELIRSNQTMLAGTISKVEFVEWKSALELKNRNITAPPLQSNR